MSNATVVKQPGIVFLHSGTISLERINLVREELENEYIGLLEILREKFSHAKIIVSSILPREELKFRNIIGDMNDFLAGCCLGYPNMEFMYNVNIKWFMLWERKHLDYNAIVILLSNVKYFVFNIPSHPSIYKRYKEYDHSGCDIMDGY